MLASEANASAEEKWATARMAVLSDLTDGLAAAAAIAKLDNNQWQEWLAGSEGSLDAMPAIGRVQAVTHQRLCDSQYPWHRRDLSDMHFLSCAAGYADFLLAEKATSHDLRRAERRSTSGAQISLSAGELVNSIEQR